MAGFLIALAALILSTAVAPVSSSTNTTCNSQCQTLVTTASSFEDAQHASTDYSFYTAPSNFSSTLPPGTVLAVEDATNLTDYTVPSSLTMSRIIYTTVDLNGTVLAKLMWVTQPSPSNSEWYIYLCLELLSNIIPRSSTSILISRFLTLST